MQQIVKCSDMLQPQSCFVMLSPTHSRSKNDLHLIQPPALPNSVALKPASTAASAAALSVLPDQCCLRLALLAFGGTPLASLHLPPVQSSVFWGGPAQLQASLVRLSPHTKCTTRIASIHITCHTVGQTGKSRLMLVVPCASQITSCKAHTMSKLIGTHRCQNYLIWLYMLNSMQLIGCDH